MNWKSIIATALITGLVTITTGMVLFWWQSEKSELTYNSIKSIPFDEVSNSLFIQQIEIHNSGDRPIEDVVLVVSFTDAFIEKSRIIIDKAISHVKDLDKKSITLKIDNLNPNEEVNVSVMYKTTSSNSSGAAISLRGKGITGKLIGADAKNKKEPVWIALIAAYAGIFAFFMSTKRGRVLLPFVAKSFIMGRSLGGDQKNHIASALSMYGYPEKAKEYLNSNADRQYWVEADLLSAEALSGDEKKKKDYIKILHLISKIPNIATTSKAIAFYNIARLNVSLESEEETINEYLDLARNLDTTEIDDRISRDPVFLINKEFNNTLNPDRATAACS